jgi:translation initiation factor IF-3
LAAKLRYQGLKAPPQLFYRAWRYYIALTFPDPGSTTTGDCYIARFDQQAPKSSNDGPRINHQIDARTVRLIAADGAQVGVVDRETALRRAEEAGLDLVEISPNASPPVCKILDIGKYKYEEQKKLNEARKKQKIIQVKEIKLRPNIDDHDYEVKMRSMHRFLEEGDKVKITLRFRGREMAHMEIGTQLLNRVKADFVEHAKVEQDARTEGRQIVMVFAPK